MFTPKVSKYDTVHQAPSFQRSKPSDHTKQMFAYPRSALLFERSIVCHLQQGCQFILAAHDERRWLAGRERVRAACECRGTTTAAIAGTNNGVMPEPGLQAAAPAVRLALASLEADDEIEEAFGLPRAVAP